MEIISNRILKPNLHANIDPCTAIPLTIFDKAAFNHHVSALYAFLPPMPTNEALIQGLSDALTHFPHLAGRLSGDHHILLNGAGIRLAEANVRSTLAAALPALVPSEELGVLHPPIEDVEELLQIQINRYACGGVVIGQTAHHRVCDGQSMSSFFLAWARLVKGLDVDPLPFHDRSAVSVPRNPPRPEHNHGALEFKDVENAATPLPSTSSSNIVNLVLHYSSDFISHLKKIVTDDVNDDGEIMPGFRCTTFQCLLAHVWKKMTLARGLKDEVTMQVIVAVNGRSRMKPSVPQEYFGNLVLWAYPKLKVKDLSNKSYKSVVKAINEAVAKIDSGYFQSLVDFGEMKKAEELQQLAGNMLVPNLKVDSWLSLRFHELDFGHGRPCAFMPSFLPTEGSLLMVPSPKEKGGGVHIYIAVAEEEVEKFQKFLQTPKPMRIMSRI